MALTLIHATTPSGTISAADMASDMTAIQNAVNSLDGGNLQAGTVTNTALANSSAPFLVSGQVTGSGSQTFYIPIYVTASEDWTAVGYRWWLTDSGTGNGSVTVRHGTLSGGTFSSNGTLVNAGSVTFDTDGADNAGGSTASGTVTSSSTVLEVAYTAGTGQNGTSTDLFKLSLQFTAALT